MKLDKSKIEKKRVNKKIEYYLKRLKKIYEKETNKNQDTNI